MGGKGLIRVYGAFIGFIRLGFGNVGVDIELKIGALMIAWCCRA